MTEQTREHVAPYDLNTPFPGPYDVPAGSHLASPVAPAEPVVVLASEPVEDPEPEDEGLEDFDAFWSAQKRKGQGLRIYGQVVHLPPSLPLQFELEARKLQRSKNEQDVRKLVGIIFGEDAMDTWAAKGMDLEQFQVLLAWAPRRIAGVNITLAEVAAEVAEAREKAEKADQDGEGPDPT